MSLAAVPCDDWLDGYEVRGAARDLESDAQGDVAVAHTASLLGRVDSLGLLQSLSLNVDGAETDLTERMAGVSVVSGFRREVSQRLPELSGTSLEGCLLDDVVGSRFIASFGLLVSHPTRANQEAKTPPLDTCSGWQANGHAAIHGPLGDTGTPNLLSAPLIEELFELWHVEPPLPVGAMVRRRALDASGASPTIARSWFRDSLVRSDDEGSLHEYQLTAVLNHGQISEVSAIAHSLPHVDCPAAASNVGLMLGERVDDLDRPIRAQLHSILGCTHLNDTLRFLRIVDNP